MTVFDDDDKWVFWGQSGKACIDGEMVEGTAMYREGSGKLVRFLRFDTLEASPDCRDANEILVTLEGADFVVDADHPAS